MTALRGGNGGPIHPCPGPFNQTVGNSNPCILTWCHQPIDKCLMYREEKQIVDQFLLNPTIELKWNTSLSDLFLTGLQDGQICILRLTVFSA